MLCGRKTGKTRSWNTFWKKSVEKEPFIDLFLHLYYVIIVIIINAAKENRELMPGLPEKLTEM